MKYLLVRKKRVILLIALLILGIVQVLVNKSSNSNKIPPPSEKIKVEISKTPEYLQAEPSESDSVLGNAIDVYHPERTNARVIGVRDGDTIEVDFGNGNKKTVRYIGIDTPETVDPRKSVQCFGKEASNINKSLVENQIVQLEKDVSETDKYGRLLRYVFLPTGDDGKELFINRYLVEEGFAHASAYPPDIRYQEDLDAAEEDARAGHKGLWGTCSTSESTSTNSSGDKDCSDFVTRQEAQSYFESKGGSSTNNVDKLDGGDHDGIVCETKQ